MSLKTLTRCELNISNISITDSSVILELTAYGNTFKALVSIDPNPLKFGMAKANPFLTIQAIIPDIFSLSSSEVDLLSGITPAELASRIIITHSLTPTTGETSLDWLSGYHDIWTQFRGWLYDCNEANTNNDTQPVLTGSLGQMVDDIFSEDIAMDPERQYQRRISGTFDGNEFSFSHSHTLGNHWVEGYIESFLVRILKKGETIICFSKVKGFDEEKKDPAGIFLNTQKEKVSEWLYNLASYKPK